jgi:hypothetical protein
MVDRLPGLGRADRRRRSLIPFDPLFPAEAEAALDIFRGCASSTRPAGRPWARPARPWVFDFVAAIFGAYDAETGRRLIQLLLPADQQEERQVDARRRHHDHGADPQLARIGRVLHPGADQGDRRQLLHPGARHGAGRPET